MEQDIGKLRLEIDKIDEQIVSLLKRRFNTAKQIVEYKQKNGLEILDSKRENDIIESRKRLLNDKEYEQYVERLFLCLMDISKSVQKNYRNIYLIGMPCSGKTSVGMILADKLNRKFIDTDELIEKKYGMKIKDIFANCGENTFRCYETEMLKELSYMTGNIVSTGGGIITNDENISIMRKSGTVFFIDMPLERLINSDMSERPLLTGGVDSMKKLYEERYEKYKSCSNICIECSVEDTFTTISDKIISEIM